ncbi:MAG: hypothetical protein M1477_06295, partial [Candidatus Thermoplasmatota archaeon]|nr:hypothetical protein [Candidatus Thermoplasmatota archaeon]
VLYPLCCHCECAHAQRYFDFSKSLLISINFRSFPDISDSCLRFSALYAQKLNSGTDGSGLSEKLRDKHTHVLRM